MPLHPSTFEYLSPTPTQISEMKVARELFATLAKELEGLLPDGPDRMHVMRTLRTAAMWTNIAITRYSTGEPRPDRDPSMPD